jgi:hypothetical protein
MGSHSEEIGVEELRVRAVQHHYFPAQWGSRLTLTIVLVQKGEYGSYAAFAGDGTEDWVVHNGMKLPFNWAKTYFPLIECEEYEGMPLRR